VMFADRCTATIFVLLVSLVVAISHKHAKSLTETDDAYILDVDLPDKSTKYINPSTRFLSSGNPAIDGAVIGLGVGVIGSLLLAKLQEKKQCKLRGRRDTASTRFLPSITGGNNCPPPYNSGYDHQYQPPYQHNAGYNPSNGYQQPNNGYKGNIQPYTEYQHPISAYQQPLSEYSSVPNLSYNPSYQPVRNQYRSFSQTKAHKTTPALFTHGLHSGHSRHQHSPTSGPNLSHRYYPGILN